MGRKQQWSDYVSEMWQHHQEVITPRKAHNECDLTKFKWSKSWSFATFGQAQNFQREGPDQRFAEIAHTLPPLYFSIWTCPTEFSDHECRSHWSRAASDWPRGRESPLRALWIGPQTRWRVGQLVSCIYTYVPHTLALTTQQLDRSTSTT